MAQHTLRWTILISFLFAPVLASAQSSNLLQNPNADLESQHWRTRGEATVETDTGNNRVFVVRNGGHFLQDVILPSDAAGKYAVLIGNGSSERIHEGGAITGRAYLYGYMMDDMRPNGGHVLEYLQGQNLRSMTNVRDEWTKMWGVFLVPKGTQGIRFFLNQAEAKGVPHNGSAARFDNLGLYLFSTKEEADAFANQSR